MLVINCETASKAYSASSAPLDGASRACPSRTSVFDEELLNIFRCPGGSIDGFEKKKRRN
jgi:hypothetical protein